MDLRTAGSLLIVVLPLGLYLALAIIAEVRKRRLRQFMTGRERAADDAERDAWMQFW